ncbi:MAG: hypothetical protein IPO09_20370 [Anaeromyxobacter sp.]|nr:hypothetical protein [Anaeromyxobacter sp.]MBL0274854.1 hypothetical protein [Anaeromyxobacter sp.]
MTDPAPRAAPDHPRRHRSWLLLAAALAALAPRPAAAWQERLSLHLEPPLGGLLAGGPGVGARSDLHVTLAAPEPQGLDFDLLGAAAPPADAPDQAALERRRTMLNLHQGLGFALLGLTVATTAVGQLSFDDKFNGGPNTERYALSHKVLAYGTAGVFAATGLLALLAPAPVKAPARLDRMMVHRIAMITAAVAMAAQVGLGIYTASREGYVNQRDVAEAHLALGYLTTAAVAGGVAVLVF